ncbi:Thymidylate kinase [Carbonactinospora thermoautotrophica]|uniref:Thymidylate kinase n=1 Tax=Carbonactinospora thermoautotrophica TaxID=1469144 RepID=A0A132MMY1_9ACTN|nr:thioredoxin domain-containing protein [Carbonactinospora thermoautotrophica]KWW99220.1 Thymidylate kinase [Carbonactinospora thermoautotrophica]
MANRLARSASPYLLQHQDNPVDWWPWCDEAFAEARRREVPVLLSVGYAACHWCHVMAHESFEDEATAALMNEHFVNIKVDREERPDVDAVYMQATQAMTGHGGWPMTVFCTPDGKPFFCGTYFPKTPRPGMPSFRQVLVAVAEAWRNRREEIERVGAEVVRRLSERGPLVEGSADQADRAGHGAPPGAEDLELAAHRLLREFDAARGGFGEAPKFPPSMTLEQLLRHWARTGSRVALDMVERTCRAMARGGIYDQLGGGFARYSVDADWVVPHFEKMLYDNALLLRVYTHWWRATGDGFARRIALETADWLLRDLRTPEGGFASALDADSEGVEGKYYVWTPAQLREVLGPEEGDWAAEVFGVTAEGTFEHGTSVLQLREDPDDWARYAAVRERLLKARAERVPPARDDKVVAAWNGLAIAALAEAGALFDRPDLVEAALGAADLLVSVHLEERCCEGGRPPHPPCRLWRTSLGGRRGENAGVLEDYGDVAEGFLALYAVTGEDSWLTLAGVLLDVVLAHFGDGAGGFYDTADFAERLVLRPQDPTDNATPSGQSAVAGALLTYAAYTGSARHREAAERALGVVTKLARAYPRFAGWGLAVAEALLDGPREVAVVGPAGDERTRRLHRVALLGTAPGAAVAVGDPAGEPEAALLRDRPLVDGRPAAYVCRHFTCQAPVTEPEQLAGQVGARQ